MVLNRDGNNHLHVSIEESSIFNLKTQIFIMVINNAYPVNISYQIDILKGI